MRNSICHTMTTAISFALCLTQCHARADNSSARVASELKAKLEQSEQKFTVEDIIEWQSTIKKDKSVEIQITKQLIAIAGNDKNSRVIRRRAIFAMGELGNREVHQFLIENSQLHLSPFKSVMDDGDGETIQVCLYVLKRQDWSVVPAILKALDVPRSNRQLQTFCSVLNHILNEDVARFLVYSEMKAWEPPHRRAPKLAAIRHRNLKYMYAEVLDRRR